MAVAEAFEDLTAGRDAAVAIPEAIAELGRVAGTRYDPAVVRALADAFKDVQIEGRIGRTG